MNILNYICFILVVLFWPNSAASRITLQATPSNIYQTLTKTLHLRCAVGGSPATIQRLASSSTTDNWWMHLTTAGWLTPWQTTPWQTTPWQTTHTRTTSKLLRNTTPPRSTTSLNTTPSPTPSLTPPHAEISHITSIIVTRRNFFSSLQEKVASLSSFDPPSANADFDKIKVEGQANSSPTGGELGYLDITWDHPNDAQAGMYTCEVYALDTSLRPISFSQTVRITSLDPTISDLAYIIAQNDKIIKELQESVNELTTKVSALNFKITQEFDQIFINITEMINEISGNKKVQNIQTGFVTCSNDYVEFLNPYSHIPTVLVMVNSIEYQGMSGSMRVTIQNLSENGFIPVCSVSGLARSTFAWIAIDSS